MRLSIIPSDKVVYMDGVPYVDIDLSWIDDIDGKKVHAVQWTDGEGHVEFVGPHQNLQISELGVFEKAISLWNEKKEEHETFLQQQLELEEKFRKEQEERAKSQFLSFDDDEDVGLDISEFDSLVDDLPEEATIPPTETHIPPIEPPLVTSDENSEEEEDEDLFYDIEELLREI